MKKLILILLLTGCSTVKPVTIIAKDTIPCEVVVLNQSTVLVMQQKKIKKEETKSTILYVCLSLLVALTGFEIIKN